MDRRHAYVSEVVCPECDGDRRNLGVEGGPCLACGGTGRLVLRWLLRWVRWLRDLTFEDLVVAAIWACGITFIWLLSRPK